MQIYTHMSWNTSRHSVVSNLLISGSNQDSAPIQEAADRHCFGRLRTAVLYVHFDYVWDIQFLVNTAWAGPPMWRDYIRAYIRKYSPGIVLCFMYCYDTYVRTHFVYCRTYACIHTHNLQLHTCIYIYIYRASVAYAFGIHVYIIFRAKTANTSPNQSVHEEWKKATRLYIYIYIYVYIYIYIYIYTYTYTHVHTEAQ